MLLDYDENESPQDPQWSIPDAIFFGRQLYHIKCQITYPYLFSSFLPNLKWKRLIDWLIDKRNAYNIDIMQTVCAIL